MKGNIMSNDKKPIGTCRFCGSPLYKSEIEGYTFQCFNCDEDFYYFEQHSDTLLDDKQGKFCDVLIDYDN